MLDLLVLLGVIGGGVSLAAWGWNRFAGHADEQDFQQQLRDFQQQPDPTPEQQAAQRDATYRWAGHQLDQLRQERRDGHG